MRNGLNHLILSKENKKQNTIEPKFDWECHGFESDYIFERNGVSKVYSGISITYQIMKSKNWAMIQI